MLLAATMGDNCSRGETILLSMKSAC